MNPSDFRSLTGQQTVRFFAVAELLRGDAVGKRPAVYAILAEGDSYHGARRAARNVQRFNVFAEGAGMVRGFGATRARELVAAWDAGKC